MEASPARNRARRLIWVTTMVAAALGATPREQSAHEIPASVVVQAMIRPDGQKLRLLVRVPLTSMRDVIYPLWGPGYVDVEAAQPIMMEGVMMWIAPLVKLYEDGERLPQPTVVALRASIPSDDAFQSYESAMASILGPPLPSGTELILEQGLLDVLLETDIRS